MKPQTLLLFLALSALTMACPFRDPIPVDPAKTAQSTRAAADPPGIETNGRTKTSPTANRNQEPISPQSYSIPQVDRIVQFDEANGNRYADETYIFFYNGANQVSRIEVLGAISRDDYYEPKDKAVFEFSYLGDGRISNGQLSFDLVNKNDPKNPGDKTYPFTVEYNADGNVSKITSTEGYVFNTVYGKAPWVSTFTYESQPDQYGNRRVKTDTYPNGGTYSPTGDLQSLIYFQNVYSHSAGGFSSQNSTCQQSTNPQAGIACTNLVPENGNNRNYSLQPTFRALFDKKAMLVMAYMTQQYNQNYHPANSLNTLFPYQLNGTELSPQGDISYDALGNVVSFVITSIGTRTSTIYYK